LEYWRVPASLHPDKIVRDHYSNAHLSSREPNYLVYSNLKSKQATLLKLATFEKNDQEIAVQGFQNPGRLELSLERIFFEELGWPMLEEWPSNIL